MSVNQQFGGCKAGLETGQGASTACGKLQAADWVCHTLGAQHLPLLKEGAEGPMMQELPYCHIASFSDSFNKYQPIIKAKSTFDSTYR
jgi:hypothetical protein